MCMATELGAAYIAIIAQLTDVPQAPQAACGATSPRGFNQWACASRLSRNIGFGRRVNRNATAQAIDRQWRALQKHPPLVIIASGDSTMAI